MVKLLGPKIIVCCCCGGRQREHPQRVKQKAFVFFGPPLTKLNPSLENNSNGKYSSSSWEYLSSLSLSLTLFIFFFSTESYTLFFYFYHFECFCLLFGFGSNQDLAEVMKKKKKHGLAYKKTYCCSCYIIIGVS